MKLIKIILLIVIIALFNPVESKLKSLRKTKAGKCDNILDKSQGNTKVAAGSDTLKSVFPSDVQTSAKPNAVVQTKAARNFFYNMAANAKGVLKNAAATLSALIRKEMVDSNNKEKQVTDDNINNGDYLIFNVAQIERQYSGSLNAGFRFFDSFFKLGDADLNAMETLHAKRQNIEEVLDKVNSDNSTPTQLLGFVALLGDMGAAVQDVINRPKPTKDKDLKPFGIKEKIKNALAGKYSDLESWSKDAYKNRSPDSYYTQGVTTVVADKTIGETQKSVERNNCDIKWQGPKNGSI